MIKVEFDINFYSIFMLSIVAISLALFDVSYFLRVGFNYVLGKYFQKKVKLEGTSVLKGFTTTNDMDLFLNHMNNARYIREADFGRFHFYERTGLYKIITKAKAHILQGACNIRYRKPIPIFTTFKVTTRIMYWDEKNLYFEQQFITSDGFIRAVLVSQNKVLNLNMAETMGKLLEKDESYRPEMPEELKLWISSMEASSGRLRKKD